MLKKNSFCWFAEAKATFQNIKASLEYHPVAFISRALNS